jgi:hypothetical protein
MMNNHNNMLDGLIDLTARKEFVSSLQNVIELIFKQYLIDRNDHSLATWRTHQTHQRALFESESDLNSYLVTDPTRANSIYTIKFSNLIEKIYQLIKPSNSTFNRGGLHILNKLRNEETHFYIDNSYLTFSQFQDLRKLIKDVYDFLERDAFLGFFGDPSVTNKDSLKHFNYSSLTCNSYNELVLNSNTNNAILEHLNDKNNPDNLGLRVDYHGNDNIFSIAYQMFNLDWGEDGFDIPVKVTQYELYRRLVLLNDYNKIYITDDGNEYEDQYGEPFPVHSFVYKK